MVANKSACQIAEGCDYVDRYLENEAQTFRQRYGPREEGLSQVLLKALADSQIVSRQEELPTIRQRCEDHNVLSLDTAELQEEK